MSSRSKSAHYTIEMLEAMSNLLGIPVASLAERYFMNDLVESEKKKVDTKLEKDMKSVMKDGDPSQVRLYKEIAPAGARGEKAEIDRNASKYRAPGLKGGAVGALFSLPSVISDFDRHPDHQGGSKWRRVLRGPLSGKDYTF